MKLPILATLASSTAAFIPCLNNNVSPITPVQRKMSLFENELGVQPPLGFWDPLGLLKDADQARFNRLRYVELKHGRIAQLAFLGHFTTSIGVRLPGLITKSENTAFSDIPSGLAAIPKLPIAGVIQIIVFIGALELAGWRQAAGTFAGDFSASNFPVGWVGEYTDEEKYELRAKELNQGRAAMMGILALMVHEKLDGYPYIFFDPTQWGKY